MKLSNGKERDFADSLRFCVGDDAQKHETFLPTPVPGSLSKAKGPVAFSCA